METLLKNIRNTSRILLENNEVEAVLGFCRGSLPMARRPFLARTPEQTEQLYWDEFCLMNLANFIPADVQGKIAVIAKGCDWRNLVVHGQEGLLSLEEKIFVLGVSCKGMLDAVKIQGASDKLERIEGIASAADELKILTPDGEFSLARKTLYRQACLECRQPAPVTADIWLTETAGEIQSLQDLADRDFDQADELNYGKEQYQEMFKNCLMCFACRDSCPLCYCKQCFVDIEKSHWISWEAPLEKLLNFHFVRAHHITGRCTGCGACESACPVNIPVRALVKKLDHGLEKSTDHKAELTSNSQPPAGIFRPSYHESFKRQ